MCSRSRDWGVMGRLVLLRVVAELLEFRELDLCIELGGREGESVEAPELLKVEYRVGSGV